MRTSDTRPEPVASRAWRYRATQVLASIIALAVTVLCGCDGKVALPSFDDIEAVVAAPRSWEGKSVRLRGQVCGQYRVLGLDASGYLLCKDAESGTSILVISKGKVPVFGETLIVIGTVTNVIIAGEFSAGVHVRERNRLSTPAPSSKPATDSPLRF